MLSKTEDKLNQLCKFSENLNSSQGISVEKIGDYLVRDIEINTKLSDEDKGYFDKPPTIQECSEAVLEMKKNKSPGLDGLRIEFYKMFWKHLKQYMFDVLIKYFEDN